MVPIRGAFYKSRVSERRFLTKYWQKEPLVIRGAFAGFKDPLSPDQLAGLSCEPSIDSRLVIERGGRKPWQVIRGPQKAARLRRLPRTHWTLLIESMDRHSDRIAELASAFSFLPRWRMDDVMVSLSPLHGTVEAHIDSYDVFLIQGQGRRRWEVDRRAAPDYRPKLDLRILKRFRPQHAWTLEPGDMLYVPPGVAHRGVTVASDDEVALTYSVGFRAPSTADLLSSILARTLKTPTPTLFRDPDRGPAASPGRISSDDLAALRRFLLAEITSASTQAWNIAAGEAVTSGGAAGPNPGRTSAAAVGLRLRRGDEIGITPGARLAWADLDKGRRVMFVNGESRELPRSLASAAPLLCGDASVGGSRQSSARLARNPGFVSLLRELLRAGVIELRPHAGR